MNIDIRSHVKNNFKDCSKQEIKQSVSSSIDKEDIVLPGLGVLFETLWKNSNNDFQNKILEILEDNLK